MTEAPPRRRRALKVLLALAGLGALAVLAGPPIAAACLKDRAAAELSKALGRPATLESLELGLLGGLKVGLKGLKAEGLASAGRVELKLGLLPLLSGKASLKRLVLEGASFRQASGPHPFSVEGLDLDLRARGLDLEPGLDPVALLQRATGDAELSVGSFRSEGIALSGLACRMSVENGVARLMEGKGALNDGALSFSGSADVQDPSRPACAAKLDLAGVRLDSRLLGLPVVFDGQVSDAGADLRWKGFDADSAMATVDGEARVKASARTFDFSRLLPEDLSRAATLVAFTALDGRFSLGNGVSTQTVVLSAADNGIQVTGTVRLSDLACDLVLQATGQLGALFHGRALDIGGTLREPRINAHHAVEKEIRREVEREVQDLVKDQIDKLLP